MTVQELQIPSVRGAAIPATLVLSDRDGPVPLVALVHGFAGSRQEGGGYILEAEALAEDGIASIRMDFSGCGDSQDSFRSGTLRTMVSDVVCCVNYACDHAPIDRSRLGLQGMSLGGRIVMELINDGTLPIHAAALISPAADNSVHAALFGSYEAFLAAYEQAKEAGFYHFYDTLFDCYLDLDVTWFSQLLTCDTLGNAKPFPGPMQVVWAADDTVVPPSVSRKAADAYHADFVEISGDGHSYGCYSDRKDVLARLVACQCAFFSSAFFD